MDRWEGVPYVDEAAVRARHLPPAPRTSPEGAPATAPAEDPVRLATVARHVEDGIVLYGADGRIEWVNEAFERMSGFRGAEVAGRDRFELVSGPFARTPRCARLAEDLRTTGVLSAEFVTRTRAGVPYWVWMEVRPTVQDGRVVGRIGVERDVTERRRAEEHSRTALRRAESLGTALRHEEHLLSTVLGTLPNIVWWKTPDLRYVGANPAYLALRGLASRAEVVGRLEAQLDAADALGPVLTGLEQRAVRDGHPVMDVRVTVPTAGDDPGRTFLVDVLPHREGGVLTGVIGIGTDVSHLTELERQLAQAGRLESIGQLAAGIAHEINTPVQYVSDNTRFVTETFTALLAGLRTLEGLLADPGCDRDRVRELIGGLDLDYLAEEVPSALAQSLEGLERVGGIVRAMKDFSHPGTGLAPVDLNRAVETTVQVSRSEWKYVAEVVTDLDPGVGRVPCHEGEIKQALLNLVVNAAQAVEERRRRDGSGPGSIRVVTRRGADEVTVRVTDDGTGMDEAVRGRVFDPFFTTKGVGKGTGQGLYLAHRTVVQRHGGRIEVESRPGAGTSFLVTLPLRPPPGVGGGEGDGAASSDGTAAPGSAAAGPPVPAGGPA